MDAKPTWLTEQERSRLIQLIDLLNDPTVTQLDTDEEAEFRNLMGRLTT